MKKWTIDKLAPEMRKAGWQSLGDYVYEFVYPNGRRYQVGLRDYENGEQVWHKWADANETPPKQTEE